MAVEPDAPDALISAEEAFGIAVQQALKQKSGGTPGDINDRSALAAYYANNGNRALWTNDQGLTDKARAIFAEIRKADDWGLRAGDFPIPDTSPTNGYSLKQAIHDEMAASLTILKYARFARGGRIADPATELSSYLDRKPPVKKVSVVLNDLKDSADPAAYLRDLHPKHDQFKKLLEVLRRMRGGGMDEEPPKPQIPASGPMLKPGMQHPDIAILRQQLEVSIARGEDGAISADVYDSTLVAAVKDFQSQNGLRPDGIVGRSTRRSMQTETNTPLSEERILANMEAWRWMPEDLGKFYVLVNIPEYRFRVFENDEVIHSERVIVGKLKNQTPSFSDEMETVVIHPSWGVPNSIKVKEILPSLARGGSVLQRQNLRIKRNGRHVNPHAIDWSRADIRNYDVYQPPGRSNVLGVVKFLFPNKHAVYMHDTPTKHLFKQTTRTYSHGCVRVRDPVQFAKTVLAADKGWDADHVDQLISGGPQNNQIVLDQKIPVHMVYFTAFVDENGEVTTLKDMYGHEKRITLALAGKRHLIARHRDHLAPVRYNRRQYAGSGTQSVNYIFQSIFGGF